MFFAIYEGTNVVLVFSSKAERDEFIRHESIVHPEIKKVSGKKIQDLIEGKKPQFNDGFGCLAIMA